MKAVKSVKSAKQVPTAQSLLDAIKLEIKTDFSLPNKFNYKRFNRKINLFALESSKLELEKVFSAIIDNISIDNFTYATQTSIEYIIKYGKISVDHTCSTFMDRSDFADILKKDPYRVLELFKHTSDVVFNRFFHAHSAIILTADSAASTQLILSASKCQTLQLTTEELNIFLSKMERMLKTTSYYKFRWWVQVLTFISLQGDSGKNFFKEEFSRNLDLVVAEKSILQRKELRMGLIKAIKTVKDKELRKEFIRLLLSKSQTDLNQALIKYYPKYTKYISMS